MLCNQNYSFFRWLQLFVVAGMIFLTPAVATAQFAPPAGQPGSTAMKADSTVFVQWASGCFVERGFVNAADTSLGYASFGADSLAGGMADLAVVSLGDGGTAVVVFETPMVNGPGYDFAIFENSFSDEFLELAFVEVSSDGSRFFRFENISNTPADVQIESFGTLDATKIHNLAGKYRGGFGTPFDLEELKDSAGLDLQNIVAVRIVDVVGSIDSAFSAFDSRGNIINDPWPTPFESSGFDLDAVGVIHDKNHTDVEEQTVERNIKVSPNPVADVLKVRGIKPGSKLLIYDTNGRLLYASEIINRPDVSISTGSFPKGLLMIYINESGTLHTLKVLHL